MSREEGGMRGEGGDEARKAGHREVVKDLECCVRV